jgi:hypothetical protein
MPCVYLPGPAPAVTVANKNYGEIYYCGSFCALGRFVPWVVLSFGRFVPCGHFELGPFLRVLFRDGSF